MVTEDQKNTFNGRIPADVSGPKRYNLPDRFTVDYKAWNPVYPGGKTGHHNDII
jgi:hypothetical protein